MTKETGLMVDSPHERQIPTEPQAAQACLSTSIPEEYIGQKHAAQCPKIDNVRSLTRKDYCMNEPKDIGSRT